MTQNVHMGRKIHTHTHRERERERDNSWAAHARADVRIFGKTSDLDQNLPGYIISRMPTEIHPLATTYMLHVDRQFSCIQPTRILEVTLPACLLHRFSGFLLTCYHRNLPGISAENTYVLFTSGTKCISDYSLAFLAASRDVKGGVHGNIQR